MNDYSSNREIYSVSQLNSEVRSLLEGSFPLLWVEGEISNFACPSSGHWYFTLKDNKAQVRCAMFRNRNNILRFKPENGLQVMIRARVGLYEGRGEFQLIAEHMEVAGDGALRQAFEALKNKLDSEGLFDAANKQSIPHSPKQIGIITSPTGAAIQDMLSVLKRRFPATPVIIYPAPVQGDKAAQSIADMLDLAVARQECDVLVLTRGGGSLEDLWAFNEEILARAIHRCNIPIVAAIGHEIDFTIADFVADYRAPTPSAAAETISPEQNEIIYNLAQSRRVLTKALQQLFSKQRQRLQYLHNSVQQQHPGNLLRQWSQRIDDFEGRYQRATTYKIEKQHGNLANFHSRLQQHSPANKLINYKQSLQAISHRLNLSLNKNIDRKKNSLSSISHNLNLVSPLATLDRGYSILQDQQQQVITDTSQVKTGDQLTARLAKGQLNLRVEENKK